MATIEFNRRRIDVKTETIRTIAELIPSLKDNHLSESEYMTSISVNGETITKSNETQFLEKSIKDTDLISFKISNSKSLLLETVDELPSYIDQMIETINLAVSFSNNNQSDLMQTLLSEIIVKIDSFIQLITQVHKGLTIESDKSLDSGQTIKQLEIHLLSVTKALLVAQKRDDEVMLIDLLDYELKDNLTQWKITAIPQIKRLNSI
jgi:hypothetical protein